MSGDINKRIAQLRARRTGTDRAASFGTSSMREALAKSSVMEAWESRAATKPHTRYVLGAMEEVGLDYTRISIETAERVGNQLKKGLMNLGINVDFRLQGSVPLNVHIRGVSDVDLLSLDIDFLTFQAYGLLGQRGNHYVRSAKNSISVLATLRLQAESILKAAFPAATVDTAGGKAITISGGSLPRFVDVVPAHWHDTVDYQSSRDEHDRGVAILNKKVPETIGNLPFLHIKRVGDRCDLVSGSLRKAIRLCKSVRADMEEEGKLVPLPSFDIAATMYHAELGTLLRGSVFDLAILAETQRHLDELARNPAYAKTLKVPDNSRFIFDTQEKLNGLNALSVEMDVLAREVSKEQSSSLSRETLPTLEDCRRVLAIGSS